ncbi:MAG: site-specific integrase [Gammaproteobacteria bacterium]
MQTKPVSRFPVRNGAPCDFRQRTMRYVADGWEGLSRDLIERFIDIACFERALSRTAQRGYRADLLALDQWMHTARERTLATARTAELRSYFRERIDAGLEPRLLDRLLASMHHFYRHMNESGCRADNPAKPLPAWSSGTTRSLLDLSIPFFSQAHG